MLAGYGPSVNEEQQQLREALKRTAVALKQGSVTYALSGGYASWALGGPEPEHDVDFLVTEEDAERAEEVLRAAGLRVEQAPEDWLFKAFHGEAMVDILFHIGGAPAPAELIRRARDVEVLSVQMRVLEATDLLATKMVALSEHSCDFGTVLPAARALREQVDWERLRRDTEHSDFAQALLYLTDRLAISPPRSACIH